MKSRSAIPALEVAKKEFYKIAYHPVVWVIVIIAAVYIYFNGAGGYIMLENFQAYEENDQFIQGYAQIFNAITCMFAIIAGFLGVMSISEERSKSTFNVLLTKPVLRRDVIIGKVTGISAFILVFITMIELITGLLLIIYFREPLSTAEYLWRMAAMIIASSLICTLITGLSVLIGLLFKNILISTSIVTTYLFIDWIEHLISKVDTSASILTPGTILFRIISPNMNAELFQTTIPFSQWVSTSIPYILLALLSVVVIVLVDCYIFSKQSENY